METYQADLKARIVELEGKNAEAAETIERLTTERDQAIADERRHVQTLNDNGIGSHTEAVAMVFDWKSRALTAEAQRDGALQKYVDANEAHRDAMALLVRVHQLGMTSAWRRMPDGSSFGSTHLAGEIASAIRAARLKPDQ